MLVQCWSTVYDAGPTLDQHWVDVSCLLGTLYHDIYEGLPRSQDLYSLVPTTYQLFPTTNCQLGRACSVHVGSGRAPHPLISRGKLRAWAAVKTSWNSLSLVYYLNLYLWVHCTQSLGQADGLCHVACPVDRGATRLDAGKAGRAGKVARAPSC